MAASGQRGVLVVGIRPVDHQQADVGEGVAERADLPVEHGDHVAVVADHAVVEPVVAVDDRRRALLGDATPAGARGPRRVGQLAGLRLLPLAVPPLQLAGDVALPAAEVAQPDRIDVDGVDARPACRRSTAGCGGVARAVKRSAVGSRRARHDRRRSPSRRTASRSPPRRCRARSAGGTGTSVGPSAEMIRCSRLMSWAVAST